MTTEELGTDGLERDRKRIRQEGEELQKRRTALEQEEGKIRKREAEIAVKEQQQVKKTEELTDKEQILDVEHRNKQVPINDYIKLSEAAYREIRIVWLYYGTAAGIIILLSGLLFGYSEYRSRETIKEAQESALKTAKAKVDEIFATNENVRCFIFDAATNVVERIAVPVINKEIGKIVPPTVNRAVANEIDRIVPPTVGSAVSNEIVPLRTELNIKLKELSELAEIDNLLLEAESGELKAFRRLEELAGKDVWMFGGLPPDSTYKYKEIARNFTARKYMELNEGHESSTKYLFLTDNITQDYVLLSLRKGDFRDRVMAVHTIAFRNMSNQIPTLIDMLDEEQNIYVIEALTRVLNMFLFDKYTMPQHAIRVLQPDAAKRFREEYEKKKNTFAKPQK